MYYHSTFYELFQITTKPFQFTCKKYYFLFNIFISATSIISTFKKYLQDENRVRYSQTSDGIIFNRTNFLSFLFVGNIEHVPDSNREIMVSNSLQKKSEKSSDIIGKRVKMNVLFWLFVFHSAITTAMCASLDALHSLFFRRNSFLTFWLSRFLVVTLTILNTSVHV